jgi:hypothetical protein
MVQCRYDRGAAPLFEQTHNQAAIESASVLYWKHGTGARMNVGGRREVLDERISAEAVRGYARPILKDVSVQLHPWGGRRGHLLIADRGNNQGA